MKSKVRPNVEIIRKTGVARVNGREVRVEEFITITAVDEKTKKLMSKKPLFRPRRRRLGEGEGEGKG